MPGLPEITVAGTMVADPEMKFLPSGVAVANFSIAANDRRFNRDTSQWEDAGATFLRCTVWRQFAENVSESLRKGQRVLVTGVLKQRSWETEQGETRYAFDVDVTEVGPSLRWATTSVNKVNRSGASLSGDTATDPWNSATASATAGAASSDEPPF